MAGETNGFGDWSFEQGEFNELTWNKHGPDPLFGELIKIAGVLAATSMVGIIMLTVANFVHERNESKDSSSLQIFVRSFDYGSVTLNVRLYDTISKVKQVLLSKLSYLSGSSLELKESELRLEYSGKELSDNSRLFDYNVVNESTLNLNLRLAGGMQQEKNVEVMLAVSDKQDDGGDNGGNYKSNGDIGAGVDSGDVAAAFDNEKKDGAGDQDTDAEVYVAPDSEADNDTDADSVAGAGGGKLGDISELYDDPDGIGEKLRHELEGKPIYVRCQDKLPCGIRQLVYLLLFLLALVIDLVLIIPSLLTLALCGYLEYTICCRWCTYNEPIYRPYGYDKSVCCCCCTPVTRRYFGKLRLGLISTPFRKRNCCYNCFSNLIGIYQVFEFIWHAKLSSDRNGGVFYVTTLWNNIGNDWTYAKENLRDSVVPFLYGVATLNYEKVVEYINDKTAIRQRNIFTMNLCKTTGVYHPLNTIALTTGSEVHKQSRGVIFSVVNIFTAISHNNKEKENLSKNLRKILPKDKDISLADIKKAVCNGLFYSMMGNELNEKEQNAGEKFISLGAAANVIPSYIHFLLGGYMLERMLQSQMQVMMGAFLKHLNTKGIKALIAKAKELNVEPNIALRTVVCSYLIGAIAGTGQLACIVISKIRSNPRKYIKMYRANRGAFIKECARMESTPSGITVLLKEDKEFLIAGKKTFVPKNTKITAMITAAHRTEEVFGKNVNSFDPSRENLNAMLSWNSVEKYFANWDDDKLSPRWCPGHNLAFFVLIRLIDNLCLAFEESGNYEFRVVEPGICNACSRLMKPFINIRTRKSRYNKSLTNALNFVIVPESLRTYFYIFFFIVSGIGIIIKRVEFGSDFESWEKSTIIYEQFGIANICIFYDDPPFTYFGAALYFIVAITAIFYLCVDWLRVYFCYKSTDRQFRKITRNFLYWYTFNQLYEIASVIYFVQIFATQPKQNMYYHVVPFVNLQFALWFLGFSHYLYFLKIDVISKNSHYYWLGIAYLIAMGVTIITKISIDLPNLFGAHMWKEDGLHWTKPVGQINDQFFMLWCTICPIFIYLIFVDRLDQIRISMELVPGFGAGDEAEHVNEPRTAPNGLNNELQNGLRSVSQTSQAASVDNSILASPSDILGAPALVSDDDGGDSQYASDNDDSRLNPNRDLVSAIEDADHEDAKELKEKYSFLFDKDSYKVFTPENFVDSNDQMIKLFLKNEREKFDSRKWRTVLAILIPILLFPFAASSDFDISIISLCGIALLCMFIGYFIHIFTIFGRAKRKPGSVIHRMYSVSAIAPGWTSMSVAYRVYAFQKHPIESISEFSAIDGGIAQSMLLTISCYSWAVVLCAIAFEMEDKGFGEVNAGDILELIGCFGLVLIGTFDLDPFNPTLQKCHYTGALLGTGTIAGFWYQQYRIGTHDNELALHLILPSILSVVAVTCFLLWQYYGYVADRYPPVPKNKKPGCLEKLMSPCIPKDEPDLSQISNISLKNVISEAIFLFCGATSMCVWMMYYNMCHNDDLCR